MPNVLAYLVLFSWPLVALILFRLMPVNKAIIWTMLVGYLFLPNETGFKLPMLPMVDKYLLPTLCAMTLALIVSERQAEGGVRRFSLPGSGGRLILIILFAMMFIGPFFTAMYNKIPIIAGPRFIPGLRLYDAFSMISAILVGVLPFFIGLIWLNTREAQYNLMRAFVLTALVYSLLALFEVRMSPQLHNWIYGFSPFPFIQQIRADGFRPVVFLNHGLMLGIYLCMAILSALALWREALRTGRRATPWLLAAIWLFITILLAKTVGATVITIILAPFLLFTGQRVQITVSVVIAVVVLLYPTLRGTGVIPVDDIYEFTLERSPERAQSLKYRLDNEDLLLEHANEKPMFGWGSWGRNQLFDRNTGEMTSTTDGIWVILIGTYGWIGYLAHFGLLTAPIFFYFVRRRTFGPSLVTSGVLLVLGANLIDLLPNAGLVAYVWLMAGSVTGLALKHHEEVEEDEDAAAPVEERQGTKAPAWLSPHGRTEKRFGGRRKRRFPSQRPQPQ